MRAADKSRDVVLDFLETQSISYSKIKEITKVARLDISEIFQERQLPKLSSLTKDWIYLQQKKPHDENIKYFFSKLIELLERDRQSNHYIIKSSLYELEIEIINRILSVDNYLNEIRKNIHNNM